MKRAAFSAVALLCAAENAAAQSTATNSQPSFVYLFVVPLLAAIAGGALSAFGAWASIGRQLKASQEAQNKSAGDLFWFLANEQARLLTKAEQFRSANSYAVPLLEIDKLIVNYQLFERNREWLFRIKADRVRASLIDTISHVQVWALTVRNANDALQAIFAEANSFEEGTPERGAANAKATAKIGEINNTFGQLPWLRSECEARANELQDFKTRM